jgi:uncharacterized RDD family membrane protein YckC
MPPPPGWAPPPPPSSGELADWGQRALGYLVDAAFGIGVVIVGFILAAIIGAVVHGLGILILFVAYIASFAYWITQLIKQGRTGQTVGKKVVGLKLIYENTGQTVGGGTSVIRAIAHFVDSLICYIGWLFPLWDAKRQTIADKIVGTVVVRVPKQPFNMIDLYTTT